MTPCLVLAMSNFLTPTEFTQDLLEYHQGSGHNAPSRLYSSFH